MKRFEIKTTLLNGVTYPVFALIDNRAKEFAPFTMIETATSALRQVQECPRKIKIYSRVPNEGYKFEALKPSEAQQ